MTCAPFDLSDTSGIEKLVEKQINEAGQIDYLLNIGGISQRSKIDETPLWLDRKIFEINYFGTIALTKAVLPYMIKQKSGHILATSSISGRFGFPLRSAYSASKQALHGFFETLYLENKINNIRTSVIIPGRVRTKISLHALDSEGKEHGKMDEGLAKGIPPEKAAKIIIRGIIEKQKGNTCRKKRINNAVYQANMAMAVFQNRRQNKINVIYKYYEMKNIKLEGSSR